MAIALAFVCAVVYGVADYSGGRASRLAPAAYVTVVGQIASLLVVFVAVLIVGTPLPDTHNVIWGVVAGLTGGIALGAFYYALSRGAMTVVAPITAVTSAVIPVVVGLIEGERPSAIAYVGMVAAVAAVALVSGAVGSRHQHARKSTLVFAFVAGVGFAVIFIALDKTTADAGLWPLVVARLCSISLMLAIAAATRTSLRGHGSVWKLAIFGGVLDMAANLLYIVAVRRGLLSVVVVVVALYPVSTVCLAFGLDRERVTRSQSVGMALAVAALVLVSIAGA
jgi:drug/metabolite transporter (DMT)-like permease